jgi:CrcB protein
MEFLSRHANLPSEVGLLVITGFLGGLTTFSTFSGEVVSLLMRGEYLWASITAASHLFGSLALTVAGFLIVRGVYAWGAS